jgi:hypothetical protein
MRPKRSYKDVATVGFSLRIRPDELAAIRAFAALSNVPVHEVFRNGAARYMADAVRTRAVSAQQGTGMEARP